MSAVLAPRVATAPPSRTVVPALAVQEARRLVLHPLMLLGFGIWLANAVRAVFVDGGPREAFETISSMLSFYPGIFTILLGGLVATRDRRAESREILAPLPGRPQERLLALVPAAAALALVGLALQLLLHGYFLLDERYVVPPGVGHLLQGPVNLMGGTLLGVMVGTWAPARASAVITMVLMVAANVYLGAQVGYAVFGPMMTWTRWGETNGFWAGTVDGSPGWHVVYLLGLTGLAASAGLLRVADRRTPVVAGGLLALAAAVVGGLGQLP